MADVVVLTDPDHPDYGSLCDICHDYLGTMTGDTPRPVALLNTGPVHVACLRAHVTTTEATP